ncbi:MULTISPECIES: hypothetical protein [Kocuria]|uniref:Sap, sulfolipid-1-addressing protein n=1 Tax=Kocuria subflava TaxID=1736139 RepID=A0A846TXB2_9MICC|nr:MULTISPECIES: hypothetical protein [Kocuria]NKE10274.1 hypothetical protein [Kocuria subflava]
MTSFLPASAAAGLAGFDPATFLIALGALGAGVRRRSVLTFTGIVVGGTALWGLLLSGVLGPRIRDVHWLHLARSGDLAAWIELALAAVILAWGLLRLRKSHRRRRARGQLPQETSETEGGMNRGLAVIGLGFVAVVVGDPAFDVQVVQAGHAPLALNVAGWLIWAALSQFPLVILAAAVGLGRYRRLAEIMRAGWLRAAPTASALATALILAAALVLAVDALDRLLFGHFLWNP